MADLGYCLVERTQGGGGAPPERLALGGQLQLARRSIEKAHTELLFQPRDVLADGGGCQIELGGSGREAAGRGRLGERHQCRQVDHSIKS